MPDPLPNPTPNPAPNPDPNSPPPAPPAPTPPAPDAENSTIRQMREQLEKLTSEKSAAELKLKEIEDAKLSETERLQREVAEAKPKVDEHGKFVSVMEQLYNEELAGVPADKLDAVKSLSANGSLADRLVALRNAKALLSVPASPLGGGTPPGTPPPTPQPPKFDPKNPPRLSDAFRSRSSA